MRSAIFSGVSVCQWNPFTCAQPSITYAFASDFGHPEPSTFTTICLDVTCRVTVFPVIRSFRHKGLKELFERGQTRKVPPDLHARTLRRLDRLQAAVVPEDMRLPGFYFHRLHGKPARYSVRVSGNWRLTFGWDGFDAVDVDLEDYH
jgi:proteic killer suppression protein